MTRPFFLVPLAVWTLAAPHVRAQSVSIYEGPAAGPGRVLVLDPSFSQPVAKPTGLQGIQLQPIDFAGRTQFLRLMPDRPRYRNDIPGAARLQLPAAVGSLYRYSRDDGAAGTAWGFFIVGANGSARSVFELTGTGTAKNQDPFVARLAIAPDGLNMLVATTSAAGGNLLEVRLSDGQITDRTAALAPQQFSDAGLALASNWGIGVSANGVWRFDRSPQGVAQAVPFAGNISPTWFDGGVVLSSNGAFAATIAGQGIDQSDVWVFSEVSSAVEVSQTYGRFAGPGFLPESLDGPYLAVSDDGSMCAWRRDTYGHQVMQEVYLTRVNPTSAQAPFHVTADSLFHPYLDGVGQFIFVGAKLLFAAGEGNYSAAGTLTDLDVFSALLTPTGATIQNLSASNGIAQPPFFAMSRIRPEGTVWIPEAQEVLLLDLQTEELMSVRTGQTGSQELLEDMMSFDMIERVGNQLVMALRSENGNRPHEIATMPANLGSDPKVVFSSQGAVSLERPAAGSGSWFSFIEVLNGFERVHLLDVAHGATQVLTTRPFTYGPSQAFAGGVLVVSIGVEPQGAMFLKRPVAGAIARLKSSSKPGFVLPGN